MNLSSTFLPDILASIRQSAQQGEDSFLSRIRHLLSPAHFETADLRIYHAVALQVIGSANDAGLLLACTEVIGESFQAYKTAKEAQERVLLVQEVADRLVQILGQRSRVKENVAACLRLLRVLCITDGTTMTQVVRFVVRRLVRALGTSSFDSLVVVTASGWIQDLCGTENIVLTHEVDTLAALQGSLVKAVDRNVVPVTMCVLDWMERNTQNPDAFSSWMDTLLRIAASLRRQPARVKDFVQSVEKGLQSKDSLRIAVVTFLRKAEGRTPSSFDMFLALKCGEAVKDKEHQGLTVLLVERCGTLAALKRIVSDLGMVNIALLHDLCESCLDVAHTNVQGQLCLEVILANCMPVRIKLLNQLLREVPALKATDNLVMSKTETVLAVVGKSVQEAHDLETVSILWDRLPHLPALVSKQYMYLLGRALVTGSVLMQEFQSAIRTWRTSGNAELARFSYETLQQVATATLFGSVRQECVKQLAKLVSESPQLRDAVLQSICENLVANDTTPEALDAIKGPLVKLLIESVPRGSSLLRLFEVHLKSKVFYLIKCLTILTRTVRTGDTAAEEVQAWMDGVRLAITRDSFQYLSGYRTKADLALRADLLVNLCDVGSFETSHTELLVPRSMACNLRQLSGQAYKEAPVGQPSLSAVLGSIASTLQGSAPLCASAFILRDFNTADGCVDSALLDAMIMFIKEPPAMGEADLALARLCKKHQLPAPDLKEMRSLLFEESLKGLSSCEKEIRQRSEVHFWFKRAYTLSEALSNELKRGLNGRLLQTFGSTVLRFLDHASQSGEDDQESKAQVKSIFENVLKRYTFSSPMATRCLFSILFCPHVSSLPEISGIATDVIRVCVSKTFFNVGKERLFPIHKSCRDAATKEALTGYLAVIGKSKGIQVDASSLRCVTVGLQALLSKSELKWLSLGTKYKLFAVVAALTSVVEKQAAILARAPIQRKASAQPFGAGDKSTQATSASYFNIEWRAPEGTFEVDFKKLEKLRDKENQCDPENRAAWSGFIDILNVISRVRKWKKLADRGKEEEMKAKLAQLSERVTRAEERLKAAIQRLVQRYNNKSADKLADTKLPPISYDLLVLLGRSITFENGSRPKRDLTSVDDTDPELGWMYQAPKKKRAKTSLRSANAFIDAALVDEDGTDDYRELEEFIVCTDGKVY